MAIADRAPQLGSLEVFGRDRVQWIGAGRFTAALELELCKYPAEKKAQDISFPHNETLIDLKPNLEDSQVTASRHNSQIYIVATSLHLLT